MIKQLYYSKMEEAINGAKLNGLACYRDERVGTKCWLLNGEIVYFER